MPFSPFYFINLWNLAGYTGPAKPNTTLLFYFWTNLMYLKLWFPLELDSKFQLLNLLSIRCKNEQYVYLLSEDDCQTLVRKLGSLYNEKCPSHYQKRRPILTSEASTARYCNFFSWTVKGCSITGLD